MANLFAFIDGAIWDLDVTIINIKTGKIVQKLQPKANKKFVTSIPSIFSAKKYKAVIYNVGNVEGHDYPSLWEFRKAIKEKLDKLKIPNHYFTKDRYNPTQCLVPANITASDGDYVIIVMASKYTVFVTVVQYTKNGWKMLSDEEFCSLFYDTPQSMRRKILGSYKPKHVILTSADFLESTPKYLIDILKPLPNLIVIDRRNAFADTIKEIFKNVMDKKYIRYYVIPTLEEKYEIGSKIGNEKHTKIVAQIGEEIPFSRTVQVPKTNLEFYLSFTDPKELTTAVINRFLLTKNCHRNKLTLNIDGESVATYQVSPLLIKGIKNLPQNLNDQSTVLTDGKIPVIGFYDNSSVICVPKSDGEKDEYQFLDGWNGMYGKQLLIAFDKEEPKFCDAAEETYQKKPSFVVSDILNVICRNPKEAKPITWKFRITKDAENPVLLEFNNFDGTKKAASPAFLLAMLLKEHIRAIKKETGGEKPKKLCFYIHDFEDGKEERKKKCEKEIEESCDLLKIQCSFVNF